MCQAQYQQIGMRTVILRATSTLACGDPLFFLLFYAGSKGFMWDVYMYKAIPYTLGCS